MEIEDIPQVADIEREAFPPPWPATNFKKDLISNDLTYYMVACAETTTDGRSTDEIKDVDIDTRLSGLKLWALKFNPASLFRVRSGYQRPLIFGFIGLWFMVDEAHIANIAVSEAYRRQGIGGHLVISAIDLAIEQHAQFVTLEVRDSNEAAKALYKKYGFIEVGIRRGYYMDNKEDAVLMTADAITSKEFRANFMIVKQAYTRKWGVSV